MAMNELMQFESSFEIRENNHFDCALVADLNVVASGKDNVS